jgi:hypothetical protein
MQDSAPENARGDDAPDETAPKAPEGEEPVRRPDPDRVAQGDEAAERAKQRSRGDVSEGPEGDRSDEPEDQRADRMAERALKTRPSVIP